MTEPRDLGPRLTDFAHSLLDAASVDGVELEMRLDIMKVVSQFWLGSTKRGGKTEDRGEGEVENFAAFRDRVQRATQEG